MANNTSHVVLFESEPTEPPPSLGCHGQSSDKRIWLSNGTAAVSDWVCVYDPNNDPDSPKYSPVVQRDSDFDVTKDICGHYVEVDTGAEGDTVYIVVPANFETVAFGETPPPVEIHFENVGQGRMVFEIDVSGAVIQSAMSLEVSRQHAVVTLKRKGNGNWTLFGALDELS